MGQGRDCPRPGAVGSLGIGSAQEQACSRQILPHCPVPKPPPPVSKSQTRERREKGGKKWGGVGVKGVVVNGNKERSKTGSNKVGWGWGRHAGRQGVGVVGGG